MVATLDLLLRNLKRGVITMPIPGDNGNPVKEKAEQEKRIQDVAQTGACVQKEVTLNKPAEKEQSIFGRI